MITGHQREAYIAGYNGKPMPPWVSKSLPMLYTAYKQGKRDKKMTEKIKKEIREWAQKIHDNATYENTEGRSEISNEEYYYNSGQIDMANAILAKLDNWFKV